MPAVSSASIRSRSTASVGPSSRPSVIRITATPVTLSPAMIARWIGAAPRQRGSSEACRLKAPSLGASSTSRGRIWPNATTTAASSPSAANAAISSGARIEAGVRTAIPCASAKACTGEGVSFLPRPRGAGGWRVDARHLEPRRHDGGEADDRELRGAEEGEAHGQRRLAARMRGASWNRRRGRPFR